MGNGKEQEERILKKQGVPAYPVFGCFIIHIVEREQFSFLLGSPIEKASMGCSPINLANKSEGRSSGCMRARTRSISVSARWRDNLHDIDWWARWASLAEPPRARVRVRDRRVESGRKSGHRKTEKSPNQISHYLYLCRIMLAVRLDQEDGYARRMCGVLSSRTHLLLANIDRENCH